MICASLSAATNAEMHALLDKAATQPADIHELRLDSLDETPQLESLITRSTRPVIATCRSRASNGDFDGDTEARRDILIRAVAAGAHYVDAEAEDVAALAPHMRDATLIAGLNDYQRTPEDLEKQLHELARLPADWIKFSVTVRRPADNLRIFEALASAPKPCIGFGMGEAGLMTRILGEMLGSKITYGSVESGRGNAPAQPTVRDLVELFRVGEITEHTRIYGLLGNPVGHYRGYRIFNLGFRALDLDSVFIPFLAESAEAFLETIPGAINLRGLSVITPHKVAALTWSDSASEAAKRIGAANTLTLRENGWRADNTDCVALVEAMKGVADDSGVSLTGASALLLGSGATARAIGVALTLLGCRVTVASQNIDHARRLADEMDWDAYELKDVGHGDWRAVANATPVGMAPDVDATLFPAERWKKDMFAFDAVRYPRVTRFLREAHQAGAITMNLDELLFQIAAGQFKMWTGRQLPASILDQDVKHDAASSTRRMYYRQQR